MKKRIGLLLLAVILAVGGGVLTALNSFPKEVSAINIAGLLTALSALPVLVYLLILINREEGGNPE